MTLKKKMIFSITLMFFFFICATGVALKGMQTAKNSFENFLDHDQAVLMTATNMLAQGLQMGQALRNVVIDPNNQQGYKNLDDAAATFKTLTQTVEDQTKAMPADLKTMQEVSDLREKQAQLHTRIVALAKSDQPAAIKALNEEETPVWREMRGRLREFIRIKNAQVQDTKLALVAYTHKMLMACVALSCLAVVFGGCIAFWLTRDVLKQLGGEPAYAVDIARQISTGDFSCAVVTPKGDASSLLFAMKFMQENLAGIVSSIRQGAGTIAVASSQIARGNLDLSQRTDQQASSLEETASAMEQLTGTVKQNADNARQAAHLAVNASDIAVKGGSVVGQVISTMQSINDSSKKIVDIISVIDGIAFQTNILALNAAVEAARAGEQGKGFAVVASEVRSLAQRSASAAKEIKILIGDSVERVDAGSRLVHEAGVTMDEIVESVKRVTSIISGISEASNEQTAGIEAINRAIIQMDNLTQKNAALVEEAAAATQSQQDQTVMLADAVSVFRLKENAHSSHDSPHVLAAA